MDDQQEQPTTYDALRMTLPAMMVNLIGIMVNRIDKCAADRAFHDLSDVEVHQVFSQMSQLYAQLNGARFLPGKFEDIPFVKEIWECWLIKKKKTEKL